MPCQWPNRRLSSLLLQEDDVTLHIICCNCGKRVPRAPGYCILCGYGDESNVIITRELLLKDYLSKSPQVGAVATPAFMGTRRGAQRSKTERTWSPHSSAISLVVMKRSSS